MLHTWGAAIIAALFPIHGGPVYLLIAGLGWSEQADVRAGAPQLTRTLAEAGVQ